MEKHFMKGCEAIAEAALRAGCRFYAGYPITPQNEIPEYMANKMADLGGVFIQGESEIASIYMVYGASCAGVRAMTSSSGPGISLKAEGISYLAAAELPAVIVHITRTGPGLGKISPAQNDYWFSTKAPGHGGFKLLVFAPATLQEAVDLTYAAFDYADRDRNPVLVIADGILGAMMESVTLPEHKTTFPDKSGWIADGCADRKPRIIKNSAVDNEGWERFKLGRLPMYERWETEDSLVEEYLTGDAEFIVTGYGTCARIGRTAVQELRAAGIKAGLIRPITVNPFPRRSYEKLDAGRIKGILDVEMSFPGQMIDDVRMAVLNRIPVHYLGRDGGSVNLANEISGEVERILAGKGK